MTLVNNRVFDKYFAYFGDWEGNPLPSMILVHALILGDMRARMITYVLR